jgi:hypothetical protein
MYCIFFHIINYDFVELKYYNHSQEMNEMLVQQIITSPLSF